MLLILQQSSRGPATFIQDAGAAALTGPQDCVGTDARTRMPSGGRLAIDALSGSAVGMEVLAPEGGFFAMFDVSRPGARPTMYAGYLLNDHGVVVVHGRAYGEAGEGTLVSPSRVEATPFQWTSAASSGLQSL